MVYENYQTQVLRMRASGKNFQCLPELLAYLLEERYDAFVIED